jgi:L-lactate dehydrogenase complex protein LldF
MRYWRAREYAQGLAPKSAVFGLSLWAFVARRRWLYRIAARQAARLLKLRAREHGYVRALPTMRGWFAVRDLPAPPGRTFQDLWRARP